MRIIQAQYGGSLSRRKGYSPCYLWQAEGSNARTFLKDVLPFLIVKKEIASKALEFFDRFWRPLANKSLTAEELAERESFKQEIGRLNSRERIKAY